MKKDLTMCIKSPFMRGITAAFNGHLVMQKLTRKRICKNIFL